MSDRLSSLLLLAACVTTVLAQSTAFEVATIKLSDLKATRGVVILPHTGSVLETKGTTLKDLIQFAYGDLPPNLVAGEPGWSDQTRFDIVAKPEGDQIPSREQYEAMMQVLLADRFQLTVHREPRPASVFLLEPGKRDAKLTAHQAGDANPRGIFPQRTPSATRVTCRDISMAELARFFQTSILLRPVLDRTNLAGTFDFVLTWRRDDRAQSDDPDLFTAIRDQLGLKLDAGKTTVHFVVVDHAEKLSAN